MRKNHILILIIVILLIIIGFMYYNQTTSKNIVRVGDTTFTLPSNYYVGHLSELDHVNITNGSNSLFIVEYNDSNITKHIAEYTDYKSKNNNSINTSEIKIGDTQVYKSMSNRGNGHYWFINNNKVYSIYNKDYNTELDKTVTDLIKSAS